MCTPSEICENGENGENSENGLDLWLGGGVCTPSENCENGENCENSDLLAHKMSKLPIFSKRPLQYPKKRLQAQIIEISGCCLRYFVFFIIVGGSPPW